MSRMEEGDGATGPKRHRTLTPKALQNAIEETEKSADVALKKLDNVIHAAETARLKQDKIKVLSDLEHAIKVSNSILNQLKELYAQNSDHINKSLLEEGSKLLSHATVVINRIKNKQTDKLSDATRKSRGSRKSLPRSEVSSTSSAKLRTQAASEAAAARKNAEYERLIAEKECERKQYEAEVQVRRDRERAMYEKDIAILTAERQLAVANAKLEAIDLAIGGEESEIGDDLDADDADADKRTEEWVRDQQKNPPFVPDDSKPRDGPPPRPVNTPVNNAFAPSHLFDNVDYALRRPFNPQIFASTPVKDVTGTQIVEALTATNQQIVSGIAKQNLPKCHPDTFRGDATLFHPWKKSFKAMLCETDTSADQEINYLHKFTSEEVQRVVDNFRKRQYRDPEKLLQSLWSELERRFGSPAVITNALLERLHESAAFNEHENIKLQEFADICTDVDSQIDSLPGLACLNFPNAIKPIVEKIPMSLRSKWEKEVARHAEKHNDAYPGFHTLAQIVEKQAIIKNHPNIVAGTKLAKRRTDQRMTLATRFISPSSQVQTAIEYDSGKTHCDFHGRDGHDLTECKTFNAKSLEEKTDWIQKASLCFLCLSKDHRARDCESKVTCKICGDSRHNALLHKDKPTEAAASEATSYINNKCTAACETNGGPSCSKIVLVDVFLKKEPANSHRVYAIVDDQSNASLISDELADILGVEGPREQYFLSTCSSASEVRYGRRVLGLAARPALGGRYLDLPTLVECDNIPADKREIPTPETVRRFAHLENIADEIPPLDHRARIQILLGRDAPELLKVRAFKNGPRGAPWAQKLLLGWTVSGQICLDRINKPVHIKARRTEVIGDTANTRVNKATKLDGEECVVVTCTNKLEVTDNLTLHHADGVKNDIFYVEPNDNDVSLSVEDRKFLNLMEGEIRKNESNNWEMPLPFRRQYTNMPNNKPQALQRFKSLMRTLNRKPQMKKDYLEFMEKITSKGHASPVPSDEIKAQNGQVWYLPHFGVYHPKKPTQIRVVFDSSAEFDDVSLNNELLPGPDLANSLLGVLIRFRRENVAVMCDIEQMFHSFHVSPQHRDFLRFLWFEDNNPEKAVIEYRMNVHLFGNGPSPAVATFGLRKTVDHGEERGETTEDEEVKDFVKRNFYVDDGLASTQTPKQAIDLVRKAQEVLGTANLRLHKVVSNSIEVMESFPTADRAKDVRDLDLDHDSLPAQRSLGVYWDLEKDAFTFRVALPEKPFTRRGVLSVVNSVYDPLGMAVPVMLEGKKLLQQLVLMGKQTSDNASLGWDDPLPERLMDRWKRWKDTLPYLQEVSVPRCYHPEGFGTVKRAELHAFSDASQDAIAAAVYLRLFNHHEDVAVTLVYGQAKVAPARPTSIPRLELCGAVMAVQAVSKVLKEIDLEISEVVYYTDSKVVMGYITNESRRFYVYVANRVQIIRSLSCSEQWRYIESERNPADLGTRGVRATDLQDSPWLSAPDFLKTSEVIPRSDDTSINESDPEIRKTFVCKTKLKEARRQGLGTERFTRFSSFSSLQRALAALIAKSRDFKARRTETRIEQAKGPILRLPTPEELKAATTLIMKEIQRDGLNDELNHANKAPTSKHQEENKPQPRKKSYLQRLDVFLDNDGIIRVGGRLRRMSTDLGQMHPIVLPKGHHVSTLIVRHHHKLTHHQGRQITHGALRQAGYWLIGGHRLIAKELNQCIVCRKLRGASLVQRMADLPADRVEEGPPFTNVGFDVFGPWTVSTRRTRGGAANSKRWGLVFTCLSSRAIHLEVLETMDASSFICALRRFFALRGPANLLRCDNGTNFIGGKNELEESMEGMDERKIAKFTAEHGCEWKFNPPHASHFGGSWERQIGTIRRVLDAMFAELGRAQLTHEILVTLMAEVAAIVNARPIATIPSDTLDDPQPLSPSMILTMKTRPLGPPPGDFLPADLYVRRRWRRVQYLADQFWTRWRREYLQTLQTRSKWHHRRRNLTVGDIVIVRDEDQQRNDWPLGRVAEACESKDGIVRKATIALRKDGKLKTMLRPIKEIILLIPVEDHA